MSVKEQLIDEIEAAPEFLLDEVLEFFLFLKLRLSQRSAESPSSPTMRDRAPLFLQVAREINQELSDVETEPLPADFSRNLDHYLYGFPKVES
jgi:hypothetical protein